MAINITIQKTSGPSVTEVPADVAEDLQAAYDALKDLPVNRQATTDPFPTDKDARLFCKQGQAWAEANGLVFQRRGVVRDNPTVVSFRIYKRKEGEKRGRPANGSKESK